MPTEIENASGMTASNSASGEASISSTGQQPPPSTATKRKRNLPGTPDPDAEVIALSPKTLMATNRFVCEICNKGFQRDQNLQLHRRGHNLPWKLRQRSGQEVRKRVYVCPEPTCVHHDPSRALGDLTGIKKHFSRKHGEKKYKCEKCSKKYAVQSDWKAHVKICGTREYRCDCGTLFSRRDSFITHRAFCDALAEESAKSQNAGVQAPPPAEDEERPKMLTASQSSPSSPAMVYATLPLRAMAPSAEQPQQEPEAGIVQQILPPRAPILAASNDGVGGGNGGSSRIFSSLFSDHAAAPPRSTGPSGSAEPISLGLSHSFSSAIDRRTLGPPSPHMSATALLQKAAQLGATTSNSSLLRGFGLSTSSTAQQEQGNYPWWEHHHHRHHQHHSHDHHPEEAMGPALVMGPPQFFVGKPTTLDLLGLGRDGSPGGGLSALITSIGGTLERATASEPPKPWDSSALFSSSSRS